MPVTYDKSIQVLNFDWNDLTRCLTLLFGSLNALQRLSVLAAGNRMVLCVLLVIAPYGHHPVFAQSSSQTAAPLAPSVLPGATKETDADVQMTSLRDTRQIAAVLGGIMSYTRWPLAPNPIRFCVLGHNSLIEQFQEPIMALGQRAVVARGIKLDADFQHDCDAIYVAAIPPDNSRVVLRRVIGNPILTVGEGSEFCSDGGMFCLHPSVGAAAGSSRPRFSANLDAIARSGLRVNPQVLLLAKTPRASLP